MKLQLKAIREKHGLSQEELSQKSGVSRVAISNIETGRVENIKTQTISKLADALGEKVTDLFF